MGQVLLSDPNIGCACCCVSAKLQVFCRFSSLL